MFARNVSRMSTSCYTAIALILLISMGEAKPVATILGAGVNLFDLLTQLESGSSRRHAEHFLSQLSSNTIFVNPVVSKWERSKKEEGDKFQIILCDSVQELYQAVGGVFKISGLQQMFDGSDSEIGIPSKYLESGFSYLLAKYTRVRFVATLKAASGLKPKAESAVRRAELGRPDSVLSFVKQYGTHYISSYSVGESVYQVYVYRNDKYRRVRLKLRKMNMMNTAKLNDIVSPFCFEYAGTVMTWSGDNSVVRWFDKSFFSPFLVHRYQELLRDEQLFRQFSRELDRSESYLGVRLNSMEKAVTDPLKQNQFKEVLDNQIKLYEANI